MGGQPPRPSAAAVRPPGPTAINQPTAEELAYWQQRKWWEPGPGQEAIMGALSLPDWGEGNAGLLSGISDMFGGGATTPATMYTKGVKAKQLRASFSRWRQFGNKALSLKQGALYEPPEFKPPPPSDGGGYYRPTRGRSYGGGSRAARVSQGRQASRLVNWRIGL